VAANKKCGYAKYILGRAEETEAHVNEAFRLSPRDTDAHVWLLVAGNAKFLSGRDEEAVVLLRRSIETNRNLPLRAQSIRGRMELERVPT
jgi:hypothetical protein